jgi:hypothetical protein
LRAQGVEEALVLAEEFQILQTVSAGENVVGDGEHVRGLVIGLRDREQMEPAVELFAQARLPGQQVDSPDAAASNAARGRRVHLCLTIRGTFGNLRWFKD